MTKQLPFQPCPSCNRLMIRNPKTQKCPNCGHEEPLEYGADGIRHQYKTPTVPDPIFDALKTLQSAVREISGTWTESIDNAMQQADAVITRRTRAMMELGLAAVDGATVPELIENADLLIGIGQDELIQANKVTNSGLAGLLLIALIGQVGCVRARIQAILSAVKEGRNPDGKAS